MQQIQFRKTNSVAQIVINNGNYSREFLRDKEPFPLHAEAELADFEKRFLATHEYLEVVEVTDPTLTATSQSAEAGADLSPTLPNDEQVETPAPVAATPAPSGKKNK